MPGARATAVVSPPKEARLRLAHVGPLADVVDAPARASERQALLAIAHEIRRVVFVEEQRVSNDLEWDGLDDEAEHFVVFAPDGAPLGTARLRVVEGVGKAERVAVHAHARGRGAGRRLMAAIEGRAIELGLDRLRLNAQVAVLPFYEKLGYAAHGEVFVEADIDHRAMTRAIPQRAQSTQR